VLRNILIGLAFLASTQASAQSEPGRFELTPFGAYSFGGTFNDIDTDISGEIKDAANFGLLFDFREGSNTQWEILYSRQGTEAAFSGLTIPNTVLDMNVHYLQGGGTYQGDGDKVRPYLAATLGATHFEVTTDGFDSDTFFSFSIGTGLQIRPNDRLGLRLEARAFGTLIKSGSSLFCVSDPAGGNAGCAITVTGEVLWQIQTMAGIVFRF
jgi:hypothetical protein